MLGKSNEFTDEFLKEIIEQPRVWTTLHNGIEIKELKYDRIDEVIKMIKVISKTIRYHNLSIFILYYDSKIYTVS